MAEVLKLAAAGVDGCRIPPGPAICDELTRIAAMVRGALPEVAGVSLSFDGRLQIHIDVRKREDVTVVELILPTLEPGLFQAISRGQTPGHPFHHRVTALVCA
jgi:hypothetical protein